MWVGKYSSSLMAHPDLQEMVNNTTSDIRAALYKGSDTGTGMLNKVQSIRGAAGDSETNFTGQYGDDVSVVHNIRAYPIGTSFSDMSVIGNGETADDVAKFIKTSEKNNITKMLSSRQSSAVAQVPDNAAATILDNTGTDPDATIRPRKTLLGGA
jgi:hypothetical protein